MEKGRIIFLNGVSSAGKTTLAKTLQDRLSEPFYVLANDMFTDEPCVLDKFVNIDMDATYQRALMGMYFAVKGFSDAGINVIVDDVLLIEDGYDRLKHCVELLYDYPILFVHVICPVDELRRREEERKNRWVGMGESQLAILTPQDTYDITVDTYNNLKEDCADKIIEFMNNTKDFSAFRILWSQL
jgi:chloramphenicol 3-O phosphotransferase